jgi:hypothetical protein
VQTALNRLRGTAGGVLLLSSMGCSFLGGQCLVVVVDVPACNLHPSLCRVVGDQRLC